jgi:hypothetical protein
MERRGRNQSRSDDTGILDAARSDERDPDRLQAAGERALWLYEGDRMQAVMQSAPL